MSFGPLTDDDFPLLAKGQFVYRRTNSSPIIGPVSMELAEDLADRLNRDHAMFESRAQRATYSFTPTGPMPTGMTFTSSPLAKGWELDPSTGGLSFDPDRR